MSDEINVSFKFRLYPDLLENPHTQAVVLGHDSAIVISVSYPDDMPPAVEVTSSIMGETPEDVAGTLEEIARTLRTVVTEHEPILIKVDDDD